MKTARVYTDFTTSDGYGAYLNGLKFFNKKNEELPVTDIVAVNSNKVTFKLNNVPGTIDIVNNYGGSYVANNIFRTEQGYTYSILPRTKDLFTITFESEIRNIAYIQLKNTYTVTKGWHIEVDGKLINEEGITPTLEVPFRFELPPSTIRCFLGTDGLYYFLRPDYDQIDSNPTPDPNAVPGNSVP